MEVSVVTEEFARRAEAAGACRVPKVGTPVRKLSQDQLIWFEDSGLLLDGEKASVPIWCLSGYGDGYGCGSGCGYGYGYGCGSGYGDGSGYGSGYGSGDGSGYGSGYGSGDGSGHGS